MTALPSDAGRVPRVVPDDAGDSNAVHSTLAEIVQKLLRVPEDSLSSESTFRDIPGWDSLSHINVVFGIEQSFGIRFSDDELEHLRTFETLGELEALIRTKLAAA